MTNQDSNLNSNSIPPKTWLVESILVTIFCCQILGIISIIYSAGVESKFYRGDIAGAESSSKTAKTLVIISVAFGIFAVIAVGIMAALGVFAGYYNS
jgi:nitrate reductase NapE component